eukprot:scaffold8620_cov62-Phaeocystis_antarctica.AAC.7
MVRNILVSSAILAVSCFVSSLSQRQRTGPALCPRARASPRNPKGPLNVSLQARGALDVSSRATAIRFVEGRHARHCPGPAAAPARREESRRRGAHEQHHRRREEDPTARALWPQPQRPLPQAVRWPASAPVPRERPACAVADQAARTVPQSRAQFRRAAAGPALPDRGGQLRRSAGKQGAGPLRAREAELRRRGLRARADGAQPAAGAAARSPLAQGNAGGRRAAAARLLPGGPVAGAAVHLGTAVQRPSARHG